MVFNPSRDNLGADPNSPVIGEPDASKTRRRRRTKGPSEKIRLLAALSLAPKVGYLKLSDIAGADADAVERRLAERFAVRQYEKGDTICPSEETSDKLLLLRSGSVDVFRISSTGRKLSVKQIDPGYLFGEMPSIGQSMLGANADAADSSEVVVMDQEGFTSLLRESPSIALNLVRQLGPKLVEAEKQHERAAFQPVTSRVASLLTRLAGQSSQVTGFTHQEMADMLGVYRETVTNAIAELKRDGLIEVGRKRISLLNREALARLDSV